MHRQEKDFLKKKPKVRIDWILFLYFYFFHVCLFLLFFVSIFIEPKKAEEDCFFKLNLQTAI